MQRPNFASPTGFVKWLSPDVQKDLAYEQYEAVAVGVGGCLVASDLWRCSGIRRISARYVLGNRGESCVTPVLLEAGFSCF
jgi:hypothetical protein